MLSGFCRMPRANHKGSSKRAQQPHICCYVPSLGWRLRPGGQCASGPAKTRRSTDTASSVLIVAAPFSSRPLAGDARKRHAMSAQQAARSIHHDPDNLAEARENSRSGGDSPDVARPILGMGRRLREVDPDVEFADLLEQRRARHAKQLRGLLDPAAGPREHRANMMPLGPAADLVQR
jgi:hypothetical protein